MELIDANVVEAAKLLKRYCVRNATTYITKECNCPFCHRYTSEGQRLYYCELSENIPSEWDLEGDKAEVKHEIHSTRLHAEGV